MSQDNHQNKVQFCRELGAIVYKILSSSNELLSAHKELLALYRPKSREEAAEFYCIELNLPDFVGLLCDLLKIIMPDDDEFHDAVAPLMDAALDVATRMVSANVIIKDIINMYIEPHDDDMYIHLCLAVLKPVSDIIHNMRKKLDKLHKETSQLWPDLLALDDETVKKEKSVLPGEVESFQLMRNTLVKAFTAYTNEYKSEHISGFFAAMQNYLEAFANGVKPEQELSFGFVLETGSDKYQKLEYMDFHFESEMLQVFSSGSFYDHSAGFDSYTNWIYSIGLNGRDENNGNYHFSMALEMVRAGANLTIEGPDEYVANSGLTTKLRFSKTRPFEVKLLVRAIEQQQKKEQYEQVQQENAVQNHT